MVYSLSKGNVMFTYCPDCKIEIKSLVSLTRHWAKYHSKTLEELYIGMNKMDGPRLCECGCRTPTKFINLIKGYFTYSRGHNSTGEVFSKPEISAKAHENYRQNLASGKTVRKRKEKVYDSSKEFKCFECPKSFDNSISLAKHWSRTHHLDQKDLYLKLNKMESEPLCECGCNEKVEFLGIERGFNMYIKGHLARVNNAWGHNPKARKNSLNTRIKMIAEGTWKPFSFKETGVHWIIGQTVETHKGIAKMKATRNLPENIERSRRQFNQLRAEGKIKPLKREEHSRWKGGISSLNNYSRAYPKLYKEWKYPHLCRAGFKCEVCGINGSKENGLEVHHNRETFSSILRKVAEENNWEHSLALKLDPNHPELYELKIKIAEEIANYHIENKVNGLVLCMDCHKELHNSHNF